jgi:excisionase family DNA binding protein
MTNDKLETVAGMARRLNCSQETVRRMIRSGEIPCVRLPGTYRLDPEKVILALSHGATSDREK